MGQALDLHVMMSLPVFKNALLPLCFLIALYIISLNFMDKASVLGDDYKILIFLKS